MEKKVSDLLKAGSLIEISPARLIANNIYEHNIPAQFFNEYLSKIALINWTKTESVEQYLYYLNDMLLVVEPDGRQKCIITKLIDDNYYVHPQIMNDDISCPVDSIVKQLSDGHKRQEEFKQISKEETENEPILFCNLRVKSYKLLEISHSKFPSLINYHHTERRVGRIYSNSDISIKFEILRPLECPKTFEDLLLPKQGSKFMIKINPKTDKGLQKYLGYFKGEYELEKWV